MNPIFCHLTIDDVKALDMDHLWSLTAELLGWDHITNGGLVVGAMFLPYGSPCDCGPAFSCLIPAYPYDLNVTNEFELYIQHTLGNDVWLNYLHNLRLLAKGWDGEGNDVSATAVERCQALILTLAAMLTTIDENEWQQEQDEQQ